MPAAVVFGDRPKSSEIFWPGEMDERRAEGAGGDRGGELSLDIMCLDIGPILELSQR